MSLTISEAELLGMPEELLLELRSYLQSMRGIGNPPGVRAEPTESRIPVSIPNIHRAGVEVGLAVAGHEPDSPVAEEELGPWSFDGHHLTISETPPGQSPAGLRIEQALGDCGECAYVAVHWRLNLQLKNIVELALEYGFDKLWQINHPQEAYLEGRPKFGIGVKYISFSRAHGDRWVFAVDVGNSKPPDVRAVVFEKKHQDLIALKKLRPQ